MLSWATPGGRMHRANNAGMRMDLRNGTTGPEVA